MRLILRLVLLGILALIGSLILVAIRHSRLYARGTHPNEDEAVRLLLATADDAQALAGLSNGVSTRHRSSPEITFNLAVVLIISLLSVALLITGICFIIVIAIAMDSRAEKDHEIESGTASTSESPRRDMDFGYNSDEENEKEHPADMDVAHWANSVPTEPFLWSTASMLMPDKMRMLTSNSPKSARLMQDSR